MEVREDKIGLDISELQKKYNLALKNFRQAESHCQDIEESYGQLVLVLAALARDQNQPRLNQDLEDLKQALSSRPGPEKIVELANSLKKFAIIVKNKEKTPEAPPKGRPEGVEDNFKDILILIVRDLAALELDTIQKKAQTLIKKIQQEFTWDNHHTFIHELQDIIFLIKNAVREERQQLVDLTQEIYSHLEDTEKDFLRTLDSGTQHLTNSRDYFDGQVAGDIRAIEQSFDMEGANLASIRSRVLEKISNIRQRLQKKREEDAAQLRQMAAEKAGAEKRLTDIHKRYQEFTEQSQARLAEMEKFRQASLTDGLTGVYNRRAYDLQIARAVEELKQGRLSRFAVIFFDIDYFKDFNTNYGHRAGDLTLRHVARFTGQSLRQGDFLARYGGDEFIIILPEADLAIGARIADKIRAGIGSVQFKIYKDQDLTVRIGLSMGVSQGRVDDDTGSVLNRADQALYLAKDLGRNRVCTEAQLKN